MRLRSGSLDAFLLPDSPACFQESPVAALHYLLSWLSRDRTLPVLSYLTRLTPTAWFFFSDKVMGSLLAATSTPFCPCWFCATFCSSFLHQILLVFLVNSSDRLKWGLVSLPSFIFWHWSECFSDIITPSCLAFLLDTIPLTFTLALVTSLVFLSQ